MAKRRHLLLLLSVLVLSIVGGCALFGGGEAPLQRAGKYEVAVPPRWKETSRGESDRAYRLPSGAVVSLTSSCNRPYDASLEVLSRHLIFGLRDVQTLASDKWTIDGAPALRTSVAAKGEGRPVRLEAFVVVRDKCVFDFALLGPKEFLTQEISEYRTFVGSFRYGKN